MGGSVFIFSVTIALICVVAMFAVYAGVTDVGVLLFGVAVFLLGSIGILLLYAEAYEDEAMRERGGLAQLVRKILKFIGLEESGSERHEGEK